MVVPWVLQAIFLIVADFIQWAVNHGVPVGVGRGSGAGSLVSVTLRFGITSLRGSTVRAFLNPMNVFPALIFDMIFAYGTG